MQPLILEFKYHFSNKVLQLLIEPAFYFFFFVRQGDLGGGKGHLASEFFGGRAYQLVPGVLQLLDADDQAGTHRKSGVLPLFHGI